MKRRSFFTRSAGTAAVAGMGMVSVKNAESAPASASVTDNGKLGGMTLKQILDQYRYDLFTDFLPFMDKYVIDHELGGFMCTVDRDGAQISSEKSAWYEGRGIWTYSYLYNKVDPNPKYLEAARKSVEFVMKIMPSGDNPWPRAFKKDGTPLSGKPDIYGDLFIANGLQEFSKSKGNEKYWDMAKEILFRRMKDFDSPDYDYVVTYAVPQGAPPPLTAPSVLGHWMVIIDLTTQMLEMKSDPQVEALASRAVDAIMNKHFNPDFALQNEVLNHDMSRNKEYAQFSYTGHAIETFWMVLHEAVRRKDKALFDLTAERLRRHIEVAWDNVYGGAFRALYDVDKNIWALDKVTWLQEEILIGTLLLCEHTGAQWAKDWFGKAYKYALEKLTLKQYGFPLWVVGGDRKVTFVRKTSRCEHFHHPRHLMKNILALDAMIKRNGRVSGLFG
ncbi:MAG: AGE family epimerase/isomerase [Candidatus Latescibacter sp.]|nr:AGE family epimerase/isomerase [Candidatus Latescibacter sp.]